MLVEKCWGHKRVRTKGGTHICEKGGQGPGTHMGEQRGAHTFMILMNIVSGRLALTPVEGVSDAFSRKYHVAVSVAAVLARRKNKDSHAQRNTRE